jgi:hypothetical protein
MFGSFPQGTLVEEMVMSADNIVVVARFPLGKDNGEDRQGFQFRVADLGFSGLPYESGWDDDGQPLPTRVADVEYLVSAFAHAQVFTDEAQALAEGHRQCRDGYVEYGCSSVQFDKPWTEYEAEAQARVAKRKGRPRREKRRRRLECTDHMEYLRDYARVIRWHERGQVFMCGDTAVSVQLIGKLMAQAKLRGEKEVRLLFSRKSYGCTEGWSEGFTPEYLTAMLEWVRVHGWFWDEVDGGHRQNGDHKFDGTTITPGLYWTQVQALRRSADEMMESYKSFAASGKTVVPDKFLRIGQDLRELAAMLLTTDIPTYRKGRRWR